MAEHDDKRQIIEIQGQRSSRWSTWIGWGAGLLSVAGLIAWLLGQFTGSVLLAAGLVAFMLIYMIGTAYFASRKK